MAKTTIEIPEEVLIEMVSCIPEEELTDILQKAKVIRHRKSHVQLKVLNPSQLDPLVGFVKLGGDTLGDAEKY